MNKGNIHWLTSTVLYFVQYMAASDAVNLRIWIDFFYYY